MEVCVTWAYPFPNYVANCAFQCIYILLKKKNRSLPPCEGTVRR